MVKHVVSSCVGIKLEYWSEDGGYYMEVFEDAELIMSFKTKIDVISYLCDSGLTLPEDHINALLLDLPL